LARGARFGLLYVLATALAQPIDAIVFQRSYLDGGGLAGIVTGGVSLALALVCLGVVAGLAALIWNRAVRRNRPAAGPDETAFDGP